MQTNKTIFLGYALFGFSLSLLASVFYLAQWQLVKENQVNSARQEPTIVLPKSKPDFTDFSDVADKKQAFFDFFTPLVQHQNLIIRQQREELLSIYSEYQQLSELSRQSQVRLRRLQQLYDLEDTDDGIETDELLEKLILRVDEIPLSMVLAQAAIESAWGTSRFALVANNYFGQWCFSEGCGVVPNQRGSESDHEVKKFKSVQASVASYFKNINTHNAYRPLREKRAGMRSDGQRLSSLVLIQELMRYSERGEEYIEELQQIISVNQLTLLEFHPDSA